jgi:hypothetical protein
MFSFSCYSMSQYVAEMITVDCSLLTQLSIDWSTISHAAEMQQDEGLCSDYPCSD